MYFFIIIVGVAVGLIMPIIGKKVFITIGIIFSIISFGLLWILFLVKVRIHAIQ